ncbi:tRNA (guanosine(37)-N1)-methyltransferase TrmD [Lujinxingia litoralis]|uniref:tRNA (guanine-N(1)-)-methyltransferase n=1 Tax=Lujinxingia litoralis TaxID=2211119 RepID=A0A328C8Z3_9DELT|nr:tRNA (guanosine(37)-N1)-methyltransferase TrmD [Lujinxingia litoralis]RAL23140.1 tRNA (guanosine(37)-N1)-methyltransferase TrmD [Lujinxingia litoralis]
MSTPYPVEILTLFPDFFTSPLQISLTGKAIERGHFSVRCTDIRDFTTDKHRTCDDVPYGGGAGMVMKPEPLVAGLEAARARHPGVPRILMSPQGEPFSQKIARELAQGPGMILVCGRYEGVDERVREHWIDREISIGDYVLTGGEVAAMVVIDAVTRLLPGVLGNQESITEESFSAPMLEYPQYTRPREFRGHEVPPILLSGDHGRVAQWRREQAEARTRARRPDLLERWPSDEDHD